MLGKLLAIYIATVCAVRYIAVVKDAGAKLLTLACDIHDDI